MQPLSLSKLPDKKPKAVIHELLNLGELGSIRAEEKTGNSWYLMQAAFSFSAGRPFLRYSPNGNLKVLYIDCDHTEEQAGFRFRAIQRVLGYAPGDIKFLTLRNEEKNWDLLDKILSEKADLYVIDGTHWFGRQYEIITHLRQSGKTMLCSEVFRHTNIDKRLLFGFSPYDTVISITPHYLANYKCLDVKTRNHVQRNKATILHMEQLIEITDQVAPQEIEKWKRWLTVGELYLKILAGLDYPTGTNWLRGLPSKHLQRDYTVTVDWLLKHEFIYTKKQRYFISRRGRVLLDNPAYDPTMATVEEFYTDMDYSTEDVVIDRFGPIEACYPMPIKLKLNINDSKQV